jgi:hypothetical protein
MVFAVKIVEFKRSFSLQTPTWLAQARPSIHILDSFSSNTTQINQSFAVFVAFTESHYVSN